MSDHQALLRELGEALTVGYDTASGTAYAMGAVNLTAPAQRLYMALDIYADVKLLVHNARFFSGCSSGEIEAQSDVLCCYPQKGPFEVYGVELEGGDSFYADGVVSGSNAVMWQLADRRADQRLSLTPDRAVLDECARLEADFRAGLL